MNKIDICERTFKFSLQIIKLVNSLPKTSAAIAIGRQVIRSGTSVGANTEEAQNYSSKKEFIRGLTIALKEARETYYWLKLVNESKMLNVDNILQENLEIIKILTVIVKNSKLRN